jgi:transposase InsO family protein
MLPMNQRKLFVASALKESQSMTKICREYGISRKTGYKWIQRFNASGHPGLADRSHAPHSHPLALSVAREERILAVRQKHRTWGPVKVKARLEQMCPEERWPAASTIGRLFDRKNETVPRTKRRTESQPRASLTQPAASNEVWTADFKGWFRTGNGQRCEPLTIQDAFSRFLLCVSILKKFDGAHVRRAFEHAFAEYGLPMVIRTDNGAPMVSTSIGGLSKFAIWLIKLGVRTERIRPGRPQENGRHERMHRTLGEETARPPAKTHRAQQHRFDLFRTEFNTIRPHAALENVPPATIYTPSSRKYTGVLEDPTYPESWLTRQVRSKGQIRWKGSLLCLSEALIGEAVGLRPVGEHEWIVYFAYLPLARITRDGRLIPFSFDWRRKKKKAIRK